MQSTLKIYTLINFIFYITEITQKFQKFTEISINKNFNSYIIRWLSNAEDRDEKQ